MNRIRVLLLPALALLLAAWSVAPLVWPAPDASAQAVSVPAIKTLFVVVMENEDWSSLAGNRTSAPYINSLLSRPDASYASQYYNPPLLHPSEPNYIWMEAGDNKNLPNGSTTVTFVDDNDPSPSHSTSTVDHFTTYLNNAGISWKAYAEGTPGTSCPLSFAGPNMFETDHVPFVFFQDVTNNNSTASTYCTAHIRPYTELASDLQNNSVPRYSFIVPTSCDNMHDSCPPLNNNMLQGDAWLSKALPQIFNSQAYQNNGAVFIVWDEAINGDGPIGFIVLSPLAKGNGYTNTIHYDHSSLLRTEEEIFGVGPFLRNAANATDLSDLFGTATGGPPGSPTLTPTASVTPSTTPVGVSTASSTPTPTAQGASATASSQISASSDDAEEAALTACSVSAGTMSLASSDLEFVNDCYDQVIGMRFPGVAVPNAATITHAYIEFTVKETTWTDPTGLTLRALAADNPSTFGRAAFDVSSRPTTLSSVLWKSIPQWATLGAKVQTPELAPILQEVVNRPGWAAGNALGIVVSGAGHRTACAWDGVASASQCAAGGAPKLVVTYSVGTGGGVATATPTPTLAPAATATPTSTASPSPTSGGTTTTEWAVGLAEAGQNPGTWSVPAPYQFAVNWSGSPGARPEAIVYAPATAGVTVTGPVLTNAGVQNNSGGSLLLLQGPTLVVRGATPGHHVSGVSGGSSATIPSPAGLQPGDLVLVYIDTPNTMTPPAGWVPQRSDGQGTVWSQTFTSAPANLGVWKTTGSSGWDYTAVGFGASSGSPTIVATGGGGAQTTNAVRTGSATPPP
jgi:phosphatidylinositol-3-phosphatase